MKAKPFKAADWFSPGKAGEHYPARMPGAIHGVYAIRAKSTKRVLYVGESHTGRLRSTIGRHLNHWIDRGASRESYRREHVQIAWRAAASPEAAQKQERALIRHYKPQDNTKGLFDDEVPFPKKPSDAPPPVVFNPFDI